MTAWKSLEIFQLNFDLLYKFLANYGKISSMETLGERIRFLRESADLSQMELSKKIDVSQPSIARYELNITEPKASDIVKMAEFFGVSTDYLLGVSEI